MGGWGRSFHAFACHPKVVLACQLQTYQALVHAPIMQNNQSPFHFLTSEIRCKFISYKLHPGQKATNAHRGPTAWQ